MAISGFQLAAIVNEFQYIFKMLQQLNLHAVVAFLFFFLSCMSVALAIVNYIEAINFKTLRSLPDLNFIVEEFRDEPEAELIDSLSERLAEDRDELEKACQSKIESIKTGPKWVTMGIVLIFMSYFFIFFWQAMVK